MIGRFVQHTQGGMPMKGNTDRRQRRNWRIGTLAVLLPLALGSTAQTTLQSSIPASPRPAVVVPATANVTAPIVTRALPPLPAGFDVHEFETIAQSLVSDERVPGMAMAIVRNGQILSLRGYGVADVSSGDPIGPHTVFRLASLSKAFAGTVTGLLVTKGALRWDTHLAEYMPSLQLSQPGAAQELTVADVLSHRVGLTRNAYDRDLESNADYPTLVQKLAYAPMACHPGQCYAYQNVAFSLIGEVVHAASGQLYGDAVSRLVFKPLGMQDASVGLEGIESSPHWARPHVRGRGGWVSLLPKPAYYRVAPAAGVNASITDMAQWLIGQTGHRPDVLPPSLLATLHAPVIETPTEMHGSSWRRERLEDAGYAIGWRVYNYAGHQVVFHGGAVQGYRGVVAMVPESDLGVAILWNSESSLPSALMPTILDRALGLQPHWLDDRTLDTTLYARNQPDSSDDTTEGGANNAAGPNASTARARPQ
jgi:beta-lactamase class C